MEVILNINSKCVFHKNFLHVCGGDPNLRMFDSSIVSFSPRMWRWSLPDLITSGLWAIFSTYVEVILSLTGLNVTLVSFSPRMWRWSLGWYSSRWFWSIFSTYVEVIPQDFLNAVAKTDFLHVCGGDRSWIRTFVARTWFSPRMWRWS